jgi:maltose 6'-phosphate phosphatase
LRIAFVSEQELLETYWNPGMSKIQLQYVTNLLTRKKGLIQQELSFFLLVENHSFAKNVDVVWAGEDGVWQTLPAMYHSSPERGKEYWQAKATFHRSSDKALPGNIQFALRYRFSGGEFWDNNSGQNYSSQANCGTRLADNYPLLNFGFEEALDDGQRFVPVTVAVNPSVHAEKVTVHWTTDDWKHTKTTRCYLKRSSTLGREENQEKSGAQVWKGLLNIGHAFRLQYSICCESADRVLWDNNFGRNYSAHRKPLKALILNLHCYQEENQDYKFSRIAKAINDLDVDIVCLQEVAEPWNDGKGDFELNSAKIINERLDSPYHLFTDWSHLGFDRYREGVAVLSKYPIAKHDSRYISNSDDPYNIHARKVVMAQIAVPFIGPVNFFSCHISWWDDGFPEQFENLRKWANAEHTRQIKGTMLCGDFNIKAGSRGYELVVDSNEYEDQFLAADSPEKFEKIFGDRRPHWQRYLLDDHRIDYIFMHKSSELKVTSGRVLFTEQDYGSVSDHNGYLMTFEPK